MVTTECSTGLGSRRRRPSLRSGLALVGSSFLIGVVLTPACTPDDEKPYAQRARLEGGKPDPGCVDQCRQQKLGDPSPPLVDCAAAEEGLEFYPLSIWDFDTGISSNMFTYRDPTTEFLDPNGWEAPTEPAPRCIGGDPSNQALHLRGGPFMDWGGGMGRDMKCLNWSDQLGRFKFDALGIGPDRYDHFATVETFGSIPCQTDADCGRGRVCVLANNGSYLCDNAPCQSEADCPEADWYCDTDSGDCRSYTVDLSCGEAPRWTMPETGREFSGEMEAACRNGNPNLSFESEQERALYEQYRELIESACPQGDQAAIAARDPAVAGSEEYLLGLTMDFSEWDGISFWARRSRDSQPGVRLAIGDKYVDEDVTYVQNHVNPGEEAHCRRNKECLLRYQSQDTCINGRPCTTVNFPDSGLPAPNPQECESQAMDTNGNCLPSRVCFDPANDLMPNGWTCEQQPDGTWVCDGRSMQPARGPRCSDNCAVDGFTDPAACVAPENCPLDRPCSTFDFGDPDDPNDDERYCWNPVIDPVPNDPEFEYVECGDNACDYLYRPFQRLDAEFSGKKCQDYAFVGGINRSFCYDESEAPPEGLEQCGDLWISPVYLNEDWQFFKVPFDQLLQQGWAKEAHRFDLQSLAVLRFTWDRGWVEYWIDDVRVYRHKKD